MEGGWWFGQVDDARLSVQGTGLAPSDDDASGSGLAMRELAGFDHHFTERTSFFTAHKCLNYFGSDLPAGGIIFQYLVAAAMRFRF